MRGLGLVCVLVLVASAAAQFQSGCAVTASDWVTASDVAQESETDTSIVKNIAPECEIEIRIELSYDIRSLDFPNSTLAVLELQINSPTGESAVGVLPERAEYHLEAVEQIIAQGQGNTLKQQFVFTWTPQLSHVGQWIFILAERPRGDEICTGQARQFTINIKKCAYCIRERDSLHSVANDFGTHWTQMWSTNQGALLSPDMVSKGQEILLGNNYTTQFGDTWKFVATRFGTTVDSLKLINPDIISEATLEEGKHLCVIPETCSIRRRAVEGITW